jgi:hypothetical protein
VKEKGKRGKGKGGMGKEEGERRKGKGGMEKMQQHFT